MCKIRNITVGELNIATQNIYDSSRCLIYSNRKHAINLTRAPRSLRLAARAHRHEGVYLHTRVLHAGAYLI